MKRWLLSIGFFASIAAFTFAWQDYQFHDYTNPVPLPALHWQNGGVRILWSTHGVEATLSGKYPASHRHASSWGVRESQFASAGFGLVRGFYRGPNGLNEFRYLDIPLWPLPLIFVGLLVLDVHRSRQRARGFPVVTNADRPSGTSAG